MNTGHKKNIKSMKIKKIQKNSKKADKGKMLHLVVNREINEKERVRK